MFERFAISVIGQFKVINSVESNQILLSIILLMPLWIEIEALG